VGRQRRLAHVAGHEAPHTLLGSTVTRELDLHGVHAGEAERMVRNFILTGRRTGPGQVVRIVTGKGSHSAGKAVLLDLVRTLLETSLAPYVAEFSLARDGGSYLVRIK
jgi:DNA-nicking Smr family endonuclease